ncbi:MAG: hypothetical protein JRI97_09385 [Deltaproteobacteria bacterium]|nr:hypothetical protein [Deltaproteobacteria bacterium]
MPLASQFGATRFSEGRRFSEALSTGPEPVSVKADFLLAAVVYDPHTGEKKAVYGSHGQSPLVSVFFEYVESGCGAFSLTFSARPDEVAIGRGDRVDLHLCGSAAPWFSGKVFRLPGVRTAEGRYQYKGHGYFADLEHILVDKTYGPMPLDDAIQEMASCLPGEIAWYSDRLPSTGYTLSGARFDRVPLKEALARLAELAGNWTFGVDETRTLYMGPRPQRPSGGWRNAGSLWVGRHLDSFELSEESDKVANTLHVKLGRVSAQKDNFASFTVVDLDSVAFFGQREKVVSAPELDNETDARVWAEHRLRELAWPKLSARARGLDLTGFLRDQHEVLRADRFVRISLLRSGLAAPFFEALNGCFRWTGTGYLSLYGTRFLKREFVCRKSGPLGRVAFMLRRVGSPGPLAVRLLEGSTQVASTSVAQDRVPGWQAWVEADQPGCLLEAGCTYTLELSAAAGDADNRYQVLCTTADAPYSGGCFTSPDAGGSWFEDTGRGLCFRAWLGHVDEYALAVKRVAYTADGEGGLSADLELGELSRPLEDGILQILRSIRREELLAQSNLKQTA